MSYLENDQLLDKEAQGFCLGKSNITADVNFNQSTKEQIDLRTKKFKKIDLTLRSLKRKVKNDILWVRES